MLAMVPTLPSHCEILKGLSHICLFLMSKIFIPDPSILARKLVTYYNLGDSTAICGQFQGVMLGNHVLLHLKNIRPSIIQLQRCRGRHACALFLLLLWSFLTSLFIFALRRWICGFYKKSIQIIKSYTRLNNKTEKSVHKMLKSFLWLRTLLFSVFESSRGRWFYLFNSRFMVTFAWNGCVQGGIIYWVRKIRL